MVRAILNDRKNMTRRVIKPQPEWLHEAWYWRSPRYDNGCGVDYFHTVVLDGIMDAWLQACPYGIPGDRLWVREAWRFWENPINGQDFVKYRAGGRKKFPNKHNLKYPGNPFDGKWRPSIHMPRWVSRILPGIVNVRVERVQDITEEDARTEGCPPCIGLSTCGGPDSCYNCPSDKPVLWFKELWNSINAKPKPKKKGGIITHYESYPWDESTRDPRTEINGKPHYCFPNPWLWVLIFENNKKRGL